MQGLMAYYYDHVRPIGVVELNSCRYNHMGMDNLYRANPNFMARYAREHAGKCRSTRSDCEDCTITNSSLIFNVHYTQCRKPWNCVSVADGTPEAVGAGIDTTTGNLEHCVELTTKWHVVRKDLEDKLYSLTNDKGIFEGHAGTYRPHIFRGHCTGEGSPGYTSIKGDSQSFVQIASLYGMSATVVDMAKR